MGLVVHAIDHDALHVQDRFLVFLSERRALPVIDLIYTISPSLQTEKSSTPSTPSESGCCQFNVY